MSTDDRLVQEDRDKLVRDRVNAEGQAFAMRGALSDLVAAIEGGHGAGTVGFEAAMERAKRTLGRA